MGWSYRYRAEDQLYADDEFGPVVFDPGASIGVPGSGNVISVGTPILGQLATWTDPTHIAGTTTLAEANFPALTGDIVVVAGTVVTTYNNPLPASKGGLPTGGAQNQVLKKNTVANYDTSWVDGGGNVSNVATPAVGQIAFWTDATHIQGIALLPAANFPPLTGDIIVASGTLATSYNNVVPTAKGGLPIGGSTGQILSKIDGTHYNTTWINPPSSGGNVANTGSPQAGQVAMWTDATHIQGLTTLPLLNLPAHTHDFASVTATPTTLAGYGITDAQPLDAELTSLATLVPSGNAGKIISVNPGATGFELITAPTGGGSNEVQPGATTIQTALAAAVAGDTVVLAPGVFDLGNDHLTVPNNVNLKGAGQDISIIRSKKTSASPDFRGILAPGNNSVISNLSVIAYSPTGTGNEDVNPISRRAGCLKSWTNVTVRNCRLSGLNDGVFSQGASLGNMIFIDCLIEAQCDVFMWQSGDSATLINCEIRHYVTPGKEFLSGLGLFNSCPFTVKAYGCRYTLAGTGMTGNAMPIQSADGRLEVYDFVIDYGGQETTADISLGDITVGHPDTMFIHNVRRSDGAPVFIHTAFGSPATVKPDVYECVVADLHINPLKGLQALVTDGAAGLAYNATVVGGGSTKYLVFWNGTNWKVLGGGTVAVGGGGASMSKAITQTAHGFAVGNPVRYTGTSYVKALADSVANAEVIGMVSAVADANNFTLTTGGEVTGLSGLTAGEVYFLSPTVAGALTTTVPTTTGQVNKAVLVATSTTSGYFFNWRGQIVGTSGGGGDGAVDSVFARTGDVVAEVGDYATFYAPLSHTQAWSTITGTPTTLVGYGITDAFTQTAADALYAPIAHSHTFASLTSKPTTLAGYGITDAVSADAPSIPQNIKNVAYTLVAGDAGMHLFHDEVTARTYTIPANSSVPFPVGTAITIVNNTGAGTITLAITTDTLRRGDGTAGTGNRTITADSIATILKTKTTEWMISGTFT